MSNRTAISSVVAAWGLLHRGAAEEIVFEDYKRSNACLTTPL
jgi:hypothetical protein